MADTEQQMLPLKVLIVEDSEDDCQFLVRYLKKHGFDLTFERVETEESMKKALQKSWDIVLSDFSMPKFSGARAFEVLKATRLDIPFIIISGTVGEDIAVEIMRIGVSDYILKSNLSRLEPAIHRELHGAKSRAHHRETEKILTNTEEQLRQSQKMEAIGQLAGGIAHDFNNMLSVMQIYCHKIKEEPENTKVKDYVDKILSVHARSVALTRQLLIFSRRQHSSTSPVSLNFILENIKEMIESLIGGSIRLSTELAPSIGPILANESQLEQVIVNLAVNARDAMPKGGFLKIKTYSALLPQKTTVNSTELPAGKYIVLEVSDTGEGIHPDNLKRLFEPFFTTKPAGKGTGLGLSIIYGIVHHYKGGIEILSQLNKGTSFKIYFPQADESLLIPLQKEQKKTAELNSQTILLVEDELELRNLISEILTQQGYKVLEATDGENALDIVSNHKGTIDLVLTDMMMPQISGSQLSQKVKETGKKIPFIYMSGYFKDPVPVDFTFIEKPFSNETLLERIKTVLN